MSGSWYLYDGHEREGPLTRETLVNRLKGFSDLNSISVWCPDYQDWEPADRVFNFAPPERPVAEINPRRSYKGRFAFYGLLAGVAICLSDYFLQWRGSQFSPWEGDGIAENIGYIAGLCGASTLIGFIIGFARRERKSDPKSLSPLDPRTFERGPATSGQDPTALQSVHHANFIARNWRGEYSLAATYWGFGFLGNLAAGLIPILTAAVLPSKSGYDPRVILASMAVAWLGVGAIGIWQMVAVWRSANRHIDARVALGKKLPWAGLAKLLVILGFMRLAGEFLNSGIPQLTEASRMAFLDDPDIPAYSIRVMRNGTEAEIVGGFKYGLTDDFTKIFDASRQIKVLHLNSVGGRIGEAMRLNALIREKGLTTYVSDGCYSACTVAFAGGRTRILRNGAKLGFHAPSFPGMSKQELQDKARDQERLFAAAGFDPSFVEKALSTPNDKIWTPTAEELLGAKVITGISDGSDFALSGLGVDTSKDQISSKLAASAPILEALRLRRPDSYEQIVTAYYEAFVTGETEVQAMSAMRDKLDVAMIAIRPMADDQVLIDFATVIADEYATLNAKSPSLCYKYATGDFRNIDFREAIPKSLLDREKEINRRAIETATPRSELQRTTANELMKKLGIRLSAKGLSGEEFELISNPNVSPSRYAEYCNTWIALYREVAQFSTSEGGSMMRQLLAGN